MTVYSSSTCPRCKVLKLKLDKIGLPYEVNENEEEMIAKGIKQIPKLELDDGKILDFAGAIAFIKNIEVAKEE